jgi:hypothetical protein
VLLSIVSSLQKLLYCCRKVEVVKLLALSWKPSHQSHLHRTCFAYLNHDLPPSFNSSPYSPSHLRTFAPSHLRTFAPSISDTGHEIASLFAIATISIARIVLLRLTTTTTRWRYDILLQLHFRSCLLLRRMPHHSSRCRNHLHWC